MGPVHQAASPLNLRFLKRNSQCRIACLGNGVKHHLGVATKAQYPRSLDWQLDELNLETVDLFSNEKEFHDRGQVAVKHAKQVIKSSAEDCLCVNFGIHAVRIALARGF